MLRSLLCFGGLVLAALVSLAVVLPTTGGLGLGYQPHPLPDLNGVYQRGFRSDAMIEINEARLPRGSGSVSVDEALQGYVHDLVQAQANPTSLELDDVFNAIQAKFPGAQYLAANLVISTNRKSLLAELGHWEAATNSEFDTVTTSVFQVGHQIGVLGVMSCRIPQFSLRKANSKGGRFFNKCPHCGDVHALEIQKESRTLILSCPYCELPFEVLAVDTGGRIRRATDFFDGFSLKEDSAAEFQPTSEQRIVALWRQVAERCEYQLDQDHISETREVWKNPRETWVEKAGDCEDTSILLADVLISAGFDARVAIGWNGNIGQHAWVVVKTARRQYLIESTLQGEITVESLVEVNQASAFYKPEHLFDRDQVYFTTARPDEFGNDYFSPKFWPTIPMEGFMDTHVPEATLSLR